jgi:hypothetical protein
MAPNPTRVIHSNAREAVSSFFMGCADESDDPNALARSCASQETHDRSESSIALQAARFASLTR